MKTCLCARVDDQTQMSLLALYELFSFLDGYFINPSNFINIGMLLLVFLCCLWSLLKSVNIDLYCVILQLKLAPVPVRMR